jgi:hypothetical protein
MKAAFESIGGNIRFVRANSWFVQLLLGFI